MACTPHKDRSQCPDYTHLRLHHPHLQWYISSWITSQMCPKERTQNKHEENIFLCQAVVDSVLLAYICWTLLLSSAILTRFVTSPQNFSHTRVSHIVIVTCTLAVFFSFKSVLVSLAATIDKWDTFPLVYVISPRWEKCPTGSCECRQGTHFIWNQETKMTQLPDLFRSRNEKLKPLWAQKKKSSSNSFWS